MLISWHLAAVVAMIIFAGVGAITCGNRWIALSLLCLGIVFLIKY